MTSLFSKYQFRRVLTSNRIAVSPMCQYVAKDGQATEWHQAHYATMAASGAGLLFLEATAVEPAGRITPGDLGLWDDRTQASLEEVVSFVRKTFDTKIVLQIGHAGRKGSSREPWNGGQQISKADSGWATFAPSALPQIDGEEVPDALSPEGLERIARAFADSARRAAEIGVDGLEIHAAHGYLLHEFLSPVSNRREDIYGGALVNRLRFPLEVFESVRAAFPDEKPVGVKVSATDWVEGGWRVDETIELGKRLKERGADWITASPGGISPKQKIPVGPNYQASFAERIRREVGIATIAVGLITDPHSATQIISNGEADFVALAMGMLYDPRWPWHAAFALGGSVDAPPSYWRAPPQGHNDIFRVNKHGAR